jgi:crotonobetainyl-CoA:carnitine CoA-transferase CaiB-like acyl-CoA transferase
MNLAGGIAAALFQRAMTGKASEVDVSLLSTAWWAAGSALDIWMEFGAEMRAPMPGKGPASGNPFMGNYRTSDGRTINLCTLAPTAYIRDVFTHLGLPKLADDPRFRDVEALFANSAAACELIADAFASHSFAWWCDALRTMKAQWAPVQGLPDLACDPQTLANDMVFEVEAADGGDPIRLVRGPVQFDHAPVATTRAPQASEHTEQVLMELGAQWDEIETLKAGGVVA